MDALQRQIGEWGERTFGEADPEAILAHLVEEVWELVGSQEPEEAADVAILLCQFAHRRGFSLRDEVIKKHAINERRVWGAPDERGVVRHVEATATAEGDA